MARRRQWPGQEFDLGEILADGRPYLTTHWADDNGEDAFNPHFAEVDESQWHTWAARWEPGKLTYTVDGVWVGEDTEHVPPTTRTAARTTSSAA